MSTTAAPATQVRPRGLSLVWTCAAVAFLLQAKRMQPLLVGLCLGTAAFLLMEAVWPTLDVALLPGWLLGPWLIANATLALWLGRQVARSK